MINSRVSIAALLLCAASSIFIAAPASAQAPMKIKESIYTRHDYARCPPRGTNDGGVARRACLGVGNVEVFWVADGASAGLWFGRRPIKESIDLGDFSRPADTIEWRLDKTSGRPRAAIVRYSVGKSARGPKDSRVAVYRLEPSGASCLMAVVAAPAKARAAADGAGSFRCGIDKRQGG